MKTYPVTFDIVQVACGYSVEFVKDMLAILFCYAGTIILDDNMQAPVGIICLQVYDRLVLLRCQAMC